MSSCLWCEKYLLAMKESLSVKEIMKLRDVGQPKALAIRKEALEYCVVNNIHYDGKRTPTAAILEVTNLSLEYYYKKMNDEAKALEIMKKNRGICYVGS